jgi:hypothetical protein
MKMIMMSSQNNLQKSVNRWQLRIGVAKKIWKIAGVIFLVIVLLNILLIIFNMSVSKNVSTDSSTTFIEIGEDDVIDVE